MKTLIVITDFSGPQAFLVEQKLTEDEFCLLDRLNGCKFYDQPDLAKRWGVHSVMSRIEWAAEQRKRKPMLKPKGQKMAIRED